MTAGKSVLLNVELPKDLAAMVKQEGFDPADAWLITSTDLNLRGQYPREPWELVQVGNCGSPLETDAGWLVLTHGVGPIRQYCIDAILLDRQDPSRMVGRLRQPLLVPTAEEREGYVPNVVYSCGSMIHHGRLVIPYAMSDSRTSFATISVRDLVRRLAESGP